MTRFNTWRPAIGAVLLLGALASAACAPAVRSQKVRQQPKPMDFKHGTTLAASGGISTASSEAGAMAGGSIGWEITRRYALEGSGAWFNRGIGADAFAATFTGQVNLLPTRQWTPFVEAGVGMYRASFDVTRSTIPGFYSHRMGAPGVDEAITFRDPAFVLGGGANLFTMGHFAIRPSIDVLLVNRDSQTYPVTTFTVRAVYHFEDHLRR